MRNALLALLLGSVYLAVYAASMSADVVYEDRHAVVGAAVVDVSSVQLGAGRSLTELSKAVQAGQSPAMYHAVNLLLHLCVAAFVGIWLRGLGLSREASWIGAAVVLLHTLSVESAAVIQGRSELIAAFFVMAALCLANVSGAWAVATVPLAVAAALMAGTGKDTGLLACALVPFSFLFRRRWVSAGACLSLMAVAGLWAWSVRLEQILGITRDFDCGIGLEPACTESALEWFRWQATAAVRLLGILPTATGNSVVFDVEAVPLTVQWMSVAWLAGLACVAVGLARRWGHAAAGLAFMLLVITARLFVPTPGSVFNEHQFYLAMPGAALIVASLWDRFAPSGDGAVVRARHWIAQRAV